MSNSAFIQHTAGDEHKALGDRLAHLRKERGLTLQQLSALVDIPVSTLSKVQNHQATLTYGNLIKLARGLGVPISALFDDPQDQVLKSGRRSIPSNGDGSVNEVDIYRVEVLAADLLNKSMYPGILEVPPAGPQDLGALSRHPGEEFVYVLEGAVRLYSEDYKPVTLAQGDSAYLDSRSGHRYVSATADPARILVVCSHEVSETAEQEN